MIEKSMSICHISTISLAKMLHSFKKRITQMSTEQIALMLWILDLLFGVLVWWLCDLEVWMERYGEVMSIAVVVLAVGWLLLRYKRRKKPSTAQGVQIQLVEE